MLHVVKVTDIHRKQNTVSGNNMNSKPKRILCGLLPQCRTQLLRVLCRISTVATWIMEEQHASRTVTSFDLCVI